jgi:hypothetical protein
MNHWNYSIAELADIGLTNTDPLVRELARLVGNIVISYHSVKFNNNYTLDEFFENPYKMIIDIEDDYRIIQTDFTDLKVDYKILSERLDAFKLDLDADEQQYQINSLKSRLLDKNIILNDLRTDLHVKEHEILRLQDKVKELEGKFSMWKILENG